MRAIRHPLSGATYEVDSEGRIVVSRDGVSGVFTGDGVWIEGEMRSADPEVCRWMRSGNTTNPRLSTSRRFTAVTSKLKAEA